MYDYYVIATEIDGNKKYYSDLWKEPWTSDPEKVCEFVSREDAEETISELGLDKNEVVIERHEIKEDEPDDELEPCCLVLF